VLHIQYNRIVVLPEELAGCRALMMLDATHNELETVPADLFLKASLLRQLRLEGNKLRGASVVTMEAVQ